MSMKSPTISTNTNNKQREPKLIKLNKTVTAIFLINISLFSQNYYQIYTGYAYWKPAELNGFDENRYVVGIDIVQHPFPKRYPNFYLEINPFYNHNWSNNFTLVYGNNFSINILAIYQSNISKHLNLTYGPGFAAAFDKRYWIPFDSGIDISKHSIGFIFKPAINYQYNAICSSIFSEIYYLFENGKVKTSDWEYWSSRIVKYNFGLTIQFQINNVRFGPSIRFSNYNEMNITKHKTYGFAKHLEKEFCLRLTWRH
jgi:hypothetical protein